MPVRDKSGIPTKPFPKINKQNLPLHACVYTSSHVEFPVSSSKRPDCVASVEAAKIALHYVNMGLVKNNAIIAYMKKTMGQRRTIMELDAFLNTKDNIKPI